MMIQTAKGFKVMTASAVVEKTQEPREGFEAVTGFFSDLHNEGFWFALTGQHFKEWIINVVHTSFEFIVDFSDVAGISVALILGLFAMAGSKQAGKYLYWTFIVYIIIKAMGVMFL